MTHLWNTSKARNVLLAGCFSLGALAYADTALTPNLVKDGAMEQWREVPPENSQFNGLKKLQVSYTDNGNILMPSGYEQGGISVVQQETKDVFSGKYALRLKASRFYMLSAFERAYYDTRQGDLYVARFMAKGKGDARVWLNVYRERESLGNAYLIEQKGTPVPDKWTLLEQRILVGQTAPTKVYPAIETTAEMLIDDFFIGRVLREDEQVAVNKVPKEYDERIAFAAAATAAPVIDGRLDEECWKTAVPFSGFRLAQEQTLLAPQQSSFRALYDDKAIYLGIEIMLPDAKQALEELNAKTSKDSAGNLCDKTADVYTNQHSIEIFLQPPGQARYVQYVASLDGCRFDGTGLGKENFAWNGQWTFGINAEKDRWSLEMRIPAADLKLDRIAPGEGWRLNVVDNKDGNYSTWAAVGNNFHTPFAFGALIAKDFAQWHRDKNQEWDAARKKAGAQADAPGLAFKDRLERTEKFSKALPAQKDGAKLDWMTVTRTYALMNYVDAVYRAMDAEMMYAGFFRGDQ